MLNRSWRVEFNRSLTVKMPCSSRQFVVRTDRPISAVLISNLSDTSFASLAVLFSGIRVPMGSLPNVSFFPDRYDSLTGGSRRKR